MKSKIIVHPQSKDEDAELVAIHEFSVPHRYKNYDEAMSFVNSGGEIIARSFHPTELEGLSGINHSPVNSKAEGYLREHPDEFGSNFLESQRSRLMEDGSLPSLYCAFQGISLSEYIAKLEFSFWEYIPGHNLYIIQDHCFPNRYRIFATIWDDNNNMYSTYNVVEDGVCLEGHQLSSVIEENYAQIIQMYLDVQELFGRGVCWVVELQIGLDGSLYFLQRSMGHEKITANFSLVGIPLGDTHIAISTRGGFGEVSGITPSAGIEVECILTPEPVRGISGEKPSGVFSRQTVDYCMEQQLFLDMKAFIQESMMAHGISIGDNHSRIIPLSRCPLHLFVPNFFDRLPTGLKQEIDRVKELYEDKMTKAEMVEVTDMKDCAKCTLHIVSDGSEARITVREIY